MERTWALFSHRNGGWINGRGACHGYFHGTAEQAEAWAAAKAAQVWSQHEPEALVLALAPDRGPDSRYAGTAIGYFEHMLLEPDGRVYRLRGDERAAF